MRKPPSLTLCFWLFITATVGVGCLGQPDTTGRSTAPPANPAVVSARIEDSSGHLLPNDGMTDAVRIVLQIEGSLEGEPEPCALIRSEMSEDLVTDFAKLPLRQTTSKNMVECAVMRMDATMIVTPKAPLDMATPYSFFVGAWAHDSKGRKLSNGPFHLALRTTGNIHGMETEGGGEPAFKVESIWPKVESGLLPPNLRTIVLQTTGLADALSVLNERWTLTDDHNNRVTGQWAKVRCEPFGWSAETCSAFSLEQPLNTDAQYTATISETAWAISFRTNGSDDNSTPKWVSIPCGPDEVRMASGCAMIDDTHLALRIVTNEDARVWIENAAEASTDVYAALKDPSQNLHSYFSILSDLSPATTFSYRVNAADPAGNTATIDLIDQTLPPLPKVTISEVRADALGPEPAQEFVELFNYGDVAIDLFGMSISDDALSVGDIIGEHVFLPAQHYALVVADRFDAHDQSEPTEIPPSTLMVRVGTSIGTSGLSNAGEVLFLRDKDGHRLSTAPALPKPKPGICVVRIDKSSRLGTPGTFMYDSAHGCTPGY